MLRHYSAMVEHGYDNDLPEMFLNREDTALFRHLSREVEYLQNTLIATLSQQPGKPNVEKLNSLLTEKQSNIDELKQDLKTMDFRSNERGNGLDVARDQLSKTREKLKHSEDRIQSTERELENVRQSARHLLEELQTIRNSRRYRLAESLAGTYNRLRRKLSP
jgi:chromosome segregation ATPase